MTTPGNHRDTFPEQERAIAPDRQQALAAVVSSGLFEHSPQEPVDPFGLLTMEQQAYATDVVAALSGELAIAPDDIRFVLELTPDDISRVVAIDASPNGQHIGLYKHILEARAENPDWYTVSVRGERVDPLTGCTEAAYRAMIADARQRGIKFLPDSLALNQHNGHVWTATMLTGEPLPYEDKVWIGSSSGGSKVNFIEQPIDRGGKSFRVRPAVVVGEIS